MAYKDVHPEQDPAEGSREVIERELARQDKNKRPLDKAKESGDKSAPKPAYEEHRPM